MSKAKWRTRAVRRLKRYLLEHQSPRYDMTGVLVMTGLVGFLASASLLYSGLTDMWLRYPISAAAAYVFFLLFLSVVVNSYESSTRHSTLELTDLVPEPPDGVVLNAAPDVSGDGIDLDIGGLDGDEGCLIVVLVALAAGLFMIAAYVVFMAPTLLAELLLDSLLIGGLYRRLKKTDPDNFYLFAFRRTWGPAVLAIAFLAIVGAGFEAYAPEAVSIGSVFEKWSASW